jgi:hypothetical protein
MTETDPTTEVNEALDVETPEPNDEPPTVTFEFQPEEDGSLPIETAVFQALGAASMCWDSVELAGAFHSEKAKAIGLALLDKIREVSSDGRDS